MNQNQSEAVSIFYMDDSGSRHPDHPVQAAKHGGDWFALGGILINEDDKARAESLIDDFRLCWPQMGKTPFHSHEIRRAQGNFSWLAALMLSPADVEACRIAVPNKQPTRR
jgi:hypothetical protein